MINYANHGARSLLRVFQWRGSVFPKSMVVAAPSAMASAVFRFLIAEGWFGWMEHRESVTTETQAWSGFSFLVGFLIIFRTSQAYNRFWDGCTSTHQMRAEWFEACSSLVTYCIYSKGTAELRSVVKFKHTLVRLFSMLHAACLAELEEINLDVGDFEKIQAFTFPLIDPASLDKDSVAALKSSTSKVELLLSWIQSLVVENMSMGVLTVPAPMMAKAFQDISSGMVAFHDSVKITYVPFPFPYVQTCDSLLLLHWTIIPFVTCHWVTSPVWAFILVYIQVFILWSLNFIAVEIENPFGTDDNDLDGRNMQLEFNRHLLLLLEKATLRVPQIAFQEDWNEEGPFDGGKYGSLSFRDLWSVVDKNQVAWTSRKENDFVKFGARTKLAAPLTLKALWSDDDVTEAGTAPLQSPNTGRRPSRLDAVAMLQHKQETTSDRDARRPSLHALRPHKSPSWEHLPRQQILAPVPCSSPGSLSHPQYERPHADTAVSQAANGERYPQQLSSHTCVPGQLVE